jgi:hypothetical protein
VLLARLELLHRAKGDTAAALAEMCRHYGSKAPAFLNAVKYLPSAKAGKWINSLKPQPPTKKAPVTAETAQMHAFFYTLDAHRRQTTELSHDAAAMKYVADCVAASKQYDAIAWDDDVPLSAAFLVTACNVAARRYAATKQLKWAAVGYALTRDAPTLFKRCPPLQLFLVIFSSLLDVPETAPVTVLDFKSVQHDSMTFVATAPWFRAHDLVAAATVSASSEMWYGRFPADTAALMTKAFRFRAPSQVKSLLQFTAAVRNSVAKMESHVANAVLGLASPGETPADMIMLLRSELLTSVLDVAAADAVCNADVGSVASSTLQEMPYSAAQQALLDKLMPLPAKASRCATAQCVAAFLLAVQAYRNHDRGVRRGPNAAGIALDDKLRAFVGHADSTLTAYVPLLLALFDAMAAMVAKTAVDAGAVTAALGALQLSAAPLAAVRAAIFPLLPILTTAICVIASSAKAAPEAAGWNASLQGELRAAIAAMEAWGGAAVNAADLFGDLECAAAFSTKEATAAFRARRKKIVSQALLALKTMLTQLGSA